MASNLRWLKTSEVAPAGHNKYLVRDLKGNCFVATWDKGKCEWLVEHSISIGDINWFMPLEWILEITHMPPEDKWY